MVYESEHRGGIEWLRPACPRDRSLAEAWRPGVGESFLHAPSSSGWSPPDELTVVVWNTHVGAGALGRVIDDLERGVLTGHDRPVEHYLLLLQEAHRAGAGVPSRPGRARAAARIHGTPPDGCRADITELARARGIHLCYVPSMRNGRGIAPDPPEDRGNAILSTLPLSRLRAFELPFERQRRVAIGARVELRSRSGRSCHLDAVSLHLDPRSKVSRAHRSFGSGRGRQIAWLLDALGEDAPVVVGGDFNTWAGGRSEEAIVRMRSRYSEASITARGTMRVAPLVPALRLDHVFFDVPREWRARFSVHDHPYGSDHRPIVGKLGIR